MKHIHFIGICGVGMSALAILWHKKGWKVTGSDAGFYPPISTHLQKHGIEYYAGWHPEKMGNPDLVVVGNVAGSENPEFAFAQKNKIPYLSYPELIAQNLVRPNSIVCAGTYGKTSCTALLALIFKNAGKKPAYMFGGLSADLDMAADDEGGQWSVIEGDEYKTSRWDERAKFFSYSPTHLLLTAVEWDHADVYPTAEKYFEAFKELVKMVPENGLLAVSENVPKKILDSVQSGHVVKYGRSANCDYYYTGVAQTKDGLEFEIRHQNENWKIKTDLIGEYQAENICGAFALASQIGIDPKTIIATLENYHGLKRRLEKRGSALSGAVVYDDIAHSPLKAKNVLETLRKIYKTDPSTSLHSVQDDNEKIICVFEPNSGNRKSEAVAAYRGAFKAADEVLLPRLTKLKNDSEFLSGEQLTDIIKKDGVNARHIDGDDELVDYLKQKTQPQDAVVFCGSHGFRGMIEAVISPHPQSRP